MERLKAPEKSSLKKVNSKNKKKTFHSARELSALISQHIVDWDDEPSLVILMQLNRP